MQNRRLPTLTSPLLRWALTRARRGEADTKTVVIIILAVVGGLMLLVCGGVVLLMVPAVQQARTAARVTQSKNNLHIIGIALHNYHDTYATFPPGGIYGEDGTEYISWQTSILPFVEQAPLYNQIDTEAPWTDPANRPYYATVVSYYQHPSVAEPPVNGQGYAVSHYAGNSQIFGPNSMMRFRHFTDGSSNTVLGGEVAAGFRPWADPGNVRDPAAGIAAGPNTFSSPDRPGAQFLFADGAVKFINSDVNPDVLEAIATPAGREPVPAF